MNKQRIYNIIQYALLVAGQEDDFTDRDLGPIHFIKYVYLADLNYAKQNDGESYTGIQWRFHNFGPWSNDVNYCIEPALDEIGAKCKTFPSHYGEEDYKRWSLSDDRLFESMGIKLPIAVSGAIQSLVHKFKKDTPSLLEYTYRTEPMRRAAPGDLLDFSCLIKSKKESVEFESKWDKMTTRKKKKFREALKTIREKKGSHVITKKRRLVPSPLPALEDDLYHKGLCWVDSLAGEPMPQDEYEAIFSDSVWRSKTRRGEFPE